MCANFECLRSWRYCNDCPEVLSRMGISRLWRNLAGYFRTDAWARVTIIVMAAVCDCVRLAIGAVSVVLFTLGVGRSTVGNLDLVRRSIGSS